MSVLTSHVLLYYTQQYNLFKIFISLTKNKSKLAEYVEPTYSKKIREEYKDREQDIPQAAKDDLAKRRAKWKIQQEAHQHKKERNKKFKQTDYDQNLMDILYRWTAGPGEFGSPSRRPLLWTGTFNIHYCQNWWVSDICLYMMYPFVDGELYEVIYGLHCIIALLLIVPVDVDKLKEYRPTMIQTMEKYERVIPHNCHGILVHCLPHIYDFQMETGSPALATAMYIFERLVAMYNRLIHDRRDPEGNLANSLDQQTAISNVLYAMDHDGSQAPSFTAAQLALVPPAVLKGLGVDSFLGGGESHGGGDSHDENKDADEGNFRTTVPARSRHCGNFPLSELPVHEGLCLCHDLQFGEVTEMFTAMHINGLTRRTVEMEPNIGSYRYGRR